MAKNTFFQIRWQNFYGVFFLREGRRQRQYGKLVNISDVLIEKNIIIQNSKKRLIIRAIIAALVLMAILVVGMAGFLFSESQQTQNGMITLLYKGNGVRVTEQVHSRFEERFPNGGSASQFNDIIIEDEKGKPVRIAYEVPNVGLSAVRMISPQTIAIAFGGRWTPDTLWIVDRASREVKRYQRQSFSQREFVTVMPSGEDILMYGDDALVLMDSFLNERYRIPFRLREEYIHAAAPSPDGIYVAFMTWNGHYEETDATYRVYLLDLVEDEVLALGEIPYSETLVWKDANTFVTAMNKTGSRNNLDLREIKEFSIEHRQP